MRTFKPLWHEGLILTPQHFQQQEQWLNGTHRQFASLAIAEPWGIIDVQLDEDTLAAGRLTLTRLKLRLPDGTPIDSSAADVLPRARDLSRDIPPDTQSVTVLAALPLLNADGSNCRFDDESLSRPRRYFREFVEVADLNGTGEEEIVGRASRGSSAVRLRTACGRHRVPHRAARARRERAVRDRSRVRAAVSDACRPRAPSANASNAAADILLAKSAALGARTQRAHRAGRRVRCRRRVALLAAALHSHALAAAAYSRNAPEPAARAALYDVLAT